MRKLKTVGFVTFALLLGGCITPPQPSQKTTSFERKTYTVDSCSQWLSNAKPEDTKDRLLWEDRLSLEALRQGDWALAKTTLDDVLGTLGGIHANDPSARKARGLFTAESKKNFIGEPYERSAAYFFRGLIYWKDGELDNARACFRSAEFEDSATEPEKKESAGSVKSTKSQKSGDSNTEQSQYSGDWVLPDYLDGLASAKLGDDSSDAVKRAQGHDLHKTLPTLDPKANVLVFVEFGQGPIKYSTGQYHEELRFASGNAQIVENYVGNRLVSKLVRDPQPSDVPVVKVTVNGQTETVKPTDDLYFQSTTRGGRVMDHVLANKAVFKKTTDTVGNVVILAGAGVGMAALGNNNNSAGAGIAALAIIGTGLIIKGVAAAATPTADTRCWDNLPQYLALATLELPTGKQDVTVEFLDPSGGILAKKTINIEVPDSNKDTVVFVNDK